MARLHNPLGIFGGLGADEEGTGHWWAQRLTAGALVPLSLWFVARVIQHTGAARAEVAAWLSNPVDAVLMLLLIGVVFHHAQLGVQVVLEDYVETESTRHKGIIVVKAACAVMAVACAVSVLVLAFGG
ncbi:MAG: succinate dehydrogenase, hydrophobic membrane anchor protein [Kiloniellales bacterium]